MRRLWAGMAFWIGLAASASAQPLLVPARDVTVLYRLSGAAADQIPGGAPEGVKLMWQAAGQRMRAEPVGRTIYALTDLQRRVANIVFATQSTYIEMRIKGGDPQSLLAGKDLHFTRRGAGRLIGLDCTNWDIHSQKIEGSGCVTPDGVVLRAEGTVDGRPGSMVAQSVSYAALPASDFVPPDGFSRLAFGAQ